jgi:two-component system sensor kinase FixL
MNSLRFVGRYPQAAATGGLLLAAAIGVLDYLVGPEILLGLFYLVPISLAAWFGGKKSGLLVSGLSTAAWIVANVLPARHSHPAIAVWNAAWGSGFFLVVSLLVSKLKAMNEGLEEKVREKTAALIDEVAEHKQTANALRESEERIRLMIENVKDYAIFMLDAGGRIATWNVGVERLLGYSETEIRGQPFSRLYPEEDIEAGKPLDAIAGATDSGAFEDEGLLVRQDGSRFWAVVIITALRDAEGRLKGFSVAIHDITERKQLENQILATSDGERRSIGHDLHDVLGQELTGVAFLAKELEELLASRAVPESAEAARIVKHVNQAIDRTRSLAKGLTPVELNAEGLMTALSQYTRQVEELFRVRCTFTCEHPIFIEDDTVAVHMFRIAQEAVGNAIRHGKAQHVAIDLRDSGLRHVLTITDDGVGIPSETPLDKGMGLRVMAYRAKTISGSFRIQRGPRCGTVVICSVPRGKRAQEDAT